LNFNFAKNMNPISETVLLQALQWRYATKKFDASQRISEAQWRVLEQAMILAPSSFGLQPWRFVWVRSREVLEKLPAMSWGQTQPVDCSHYVVFALRKDLSAGDVDRFVDRMAEVRGVARESLEGYQGVMLKAQKTASEQGWINAWSARQVYIALGQAMTAAAVLGIDTCALEGIDTAKYDELLGLREDGYTALCGLAFGYRSDDDKYALAPKVRFPAADVLRVV
jgi:nitroreductase